MDNSWGELPVGAMVAIGLLVAAQLTLQVIALVQLVRTPVERVSIGGRKWVWVLIIAFTEVLGAILWFVLGKKPETATPPVVAADAEAQRSAVDTLYGGRKAP